MSSSHTLALCFGGKRHLGRARTALVALGAVAAAALFAAPAEAHPHRTILHHGKVFTADPAAPWAEAVAVQGKRILAVGSNEDVLALAGPHADVIDLGGRTVVPGIDDSHVHVLGSPGVPLNDGSFVPGPGPSLPDVLGLLAQGAATEPSGTWLTALVGEAFLDDAGATRFALDTVSPDHPVWIQSWTGHGVYLNTAAMAALDVSETEPDPFGGHFERFPDSQIITGEAHEYAEHRLRRKVLSLEPDSALVARYQAFAAQAVALGITSIQDMAVGLEHARAISVVESADLPIRTRAICFPLDLDEECGPSTGDDEESDDSPASSKVTASGVKWITDGTPIERLAFLETPYQDRPGEFGQFNFAQAPFLQMIEEALSGPTRREQRLFHAVGDAAIENILGAMEATGTPARWRHKRLRIEHFDLLFPESFHRAKSLGVVLVQNPTHLALPGVWAQRFTPSVAAKTEPLRSVLEAGIPLAFGSDAIGQPGNPWLDIFFAAIHPVRPEEALSVEQAVTAYTRGAAYAELAEKRKGTLKPGKLADLAVLSQDVFSIPLGALPGTYSVLTMVGGEVVWSTGQL